MSQRDLKRKNKYKTENVKEKEKEKIGLHVLYPGPSEGSTELRADIIAIHGLGGHLYSTWTDCHGHMWLRDSLPRLIPHARTMTFGYDSMLLGKSASSLTDFATDLFERIQLNRRLPAEKKRDIIFICHSLGGIVCKKALVVAHERPDYTPILDCVHGIVFMGTPHRGSKLASLASPLANIVNAVSVSKHVPSKLSDNLKKLSPALSEVSKACVHRLERIRIVSFYEQKHLKPLGCLVVEPFSAVLDLPNEKPLPISADHRSMVRFSVHEEEKFRPLWGAIAELIQNPQIQGTVEHVLAKYGKQDSSLLNVSVLWEALGVSLGTNLLCNTFIVVDAPDEMEPSELDDFLSGLTRIAEQLRQDQRSQGIKFFITSRPDAEIAVRLGNKVTTECQIPSRNVRFDVESFVKAAVSQFGKENGFPRRVISRIESEIIRKADDMFLWASLAWAHFREGVSIWSEKVVDERLALLTRRPLSCREIAEVLAAKEGHRYYSDLDVAFSIDATIQRTCLDLVQISSAGAVSFSHQSIKEFYVQRWGDVRLKAANRRLASACLRYLSFSDIGQVAREDLQRDIRQTCLLLERFHLFEYAAQHLLAHLREVPHDDDFWIYFSQIDQDSAAFNTISCPNHYDHVHESYMPSSPLKIVMLTGSLALVRRIVSHGYNVNKRYPIPEYRYFRGSRGGTVLHDFIEKDNWVDLLLELGASPNEEDLLGRTPLHLASIRGRKQGTIRKLLAMNSIDLNIQDTRGFTALHWAVCLGVVDLVDRLLADERVDFEIEDQEGRTAFTLAGYGADNSIMKQFLKSPGKLMTQENNTSMSPLICAAEKEWKDVMIDLIQKVSDINVHRGIDGKGILHWAVLNGWEDIINLAVQAGAKVNQIDTLGKTPLHYAAELGVHAAARRLLKYGASLNLSDNYGRTCLHTAAIEGFTDVLSLLIQESTFDVNEKDHQHRSLVHWAATWDWTSIMTLVLEQPDLEVIRKDTYGRTALHVSALRGCPNVMQKLIDLDVFDINQADYAGNTLLHLAARGGSATVASILVNHSGFWKNRVNKWEQTALDTASIYDSVEVMTILRKAGLRFYAATDPLLWPPEITTSEDCEPEPSVTYNPDGSVRAGELIHYERKDNEKDDFAA